MAQRREQYFPSLNNVEQQQFGPASLVVRSPLLSTSIHVHIDGVPSMKYEISNPMYSGPSDLTGGLLYLQLS